MQKWRMGDITDPKLTLIIQFSNLEVELNLLRVGLLMRNFFLYTEFGELV